MWRQQRLGDAAVRARRARERLSARGSPAFAFSMLRCSRGRDGRGPHCMTAGTCSSRSRSCMVLLSNSLHRSAGSRSAVRVAGLSLRRRTPGSLCREETVESRCASRAPAVPHPASTASSASSPKPVLTAYLAAWSAASSVALSLRSSRGYVAGAGTERAHHVTRARRSSPAARQPFPRNAAALKGAAPARA
ncbi:hypothetical protein FA09DRAFT_36073 [Tilletiopsis washingtonensis]|uniref:Uncharacterized protein n=1 Tax=Tilletiopsis washingtonensis TaxID=58919 RepID=A0A316ZCK5_9BASI|nr:hypothetical protein FA09DRAFT_36073 [Tilletiopsis washingtonensis]PWN98015.1 hypothetical protein FA09DRAFT_36073 [Tilletiopsis washingtonensis]